MTSYWWVDRALPGIASGAIMAVVLAVSHLLMRRYIADVTDRQNHRIDRLTAAQTATITGSAPPATEGTPMTEIPAPEAEAEPQKHHAVVHPRELLSRQRGLSHKDLLPPQARGVAASVARLNTRAAIFVCACYGSAAAVWLFAVFAIVSGLAKGQEQITLLTWSNGVQLVFCAVGTLASIVTQKQGQAKADADHASQTHIATVGDENNTLLKQLLAANAAGADATP